MKKELWKPVKNYEGIYEVSSFGRVRSLDRVSNSGRNLKGKIIKNCVKNDGYMLVGLSKNGIQKTSYVHRLVANAFVLKKDNKKEINHIDGNKKNNKYLNLEWSNRSENVKHAYDSGLKKPNHYKLTDKQVMEIKEMINDGKTNVEISEIYNVSDSTVSRIKNGFTWSRIKTS